MQGGAGKGAEPRCWRGSAWERGGGNPSSGWADCGGVVRAWWGVALGVGPGGVGLWVLGGEETTEVNGTH